MKSSSPVVGHRIVELSSWLDHFWSSLCGGGSSANDSRAAVSGVRRASPSIKCQKGQWHDIVVSEMGFGTQRWVSTDYNAPDEAACVEVVDLAILKWLNSIRYQATVVHEHKKTIRNDSLASG